MTEETRPRYAPNNMNHQFTAIFEADAEYGGYTVTIPALPGCISEGETFDEALANIKEAAELYLEVLKEKGEKIPGENDGEVVVAPVRIATP